MKFTAATNMPSPMLSRVLLRLCKKSTRTAVEKVKIYYEPAYDGIFDIVVSAESIWRKRGHSSSCGIVTVLPTITGKDRVKGL